MIERGEDAGGPVFGLHHATLHLHLGDGGQDQWHSDAEQSQLRRQERSGRRSLSLTVKELQSSLKLHRLQAQRTSERVCVYVCVCVCVCV